MSYTALKQGLQQLLHEDMTNRRSIQEMRRDVFLNSEAVGKKARELEEKEQLIAGLHDKLEHKAGTLQSKDEKIAELNKQLADEQQAVIDLRIQLEGETRQLNQQISELNDKLEAGAVIQEEINKLTLENNHYSAKIRELVLHIDGQQEREKNLQKELSVKAGQLKNLHSEKDKLLQEIEKYTQQNLFSEHGHKKQEEDLQLLRQKLHLVETQLSDARQLIQSQNITVFNAEAQLLKLKTDYNLAIEELYNEKMQIVLDNATLLAERGLWEVEEEKLKAEITQQQRVYEDIKAAFNEFSDQAYETAHRLEMEKRQLTAETDGLKLELEDLSLASHQATDTNSQAMRLLEEELEVLKQANTRLKEENSALINLTREDKIKFDTRVRQLSDELQVSRSECRELSNTIEQEKLRSAKESLSFQEEMHTLRHTLEVISSASTEATGFFEKQKATFTQEIGNLKALSQDLLSEKAGLLAQNDELRLESIHLHGRIDQLNDSIRQQAGLFQIEKESLLLELTNLNGLVQEITANKTPARSGEEDAFIDKLFKQIDQVSDEKQRLQTEKEGVEEEVGRLEHKIAGLSEIIENQKGEIKSLEETNKQIKLAQTLVLSAKDKTTTKLKINELVREIDKCIALLSV